MLARSLPEFLHFTRSGQRKSINFRNCLIFHRFIATAAEEFADWLDRFLCTKCVRVCSTEFTVRSQRALTEHFTIAQTKRKKKTVRISGMPFMNQTRVREPVGQTLSRSPSFSLHTLEFTLNARNSFHLKFDMLVWRRLVRSPDCHRIHCELADRLHFRCERSTPATTDFAQLCFVRSRARNVYLFGWKCSFRVECDKLIGSACDMWAILHFIFVIVLLLIGLEMFAFELQCV